MAEEWIALFEGMWGNKHNDRDFIGNFGVNAEICVELWSYLADKGFKKKTFADGFVFS